MLRPVAEFRTTLLAWFDRSHREMPWRRPAGKPESVLDPYAVLVSEAMLQQTQVATVIPYFNRWLDRFPSVRYLAEADEQEVLRHWQGLGYYNRARNLHKAAKHIAGPLAGRFPDTVEALLNLPGVGPYTAGAVASIAFDRPVPLVDGNVERVVTRLFAYTEDPRTQSGRAWVWERAGELVPQVRPGDFNSALMELGATVCAPKRPNCLLCPVSAFCAAREAGMETRIPPPKPAKATPAKTRIVFCLRRPDGTFLLEQRTGTGRWASLWQFPSRTETPEADPAHPTLPAGLRSQPLDPVFHALTHRRYTFHPRLYNVPQSYDFAPGRPAAWTTLDRLGDYPLPKPHLTIATMLTAMVGHSRVPTPVAKKKRDR